MSVRYLEQTDESNTSGSKFVVDCATLINTTGTTDDWLDKITRLQSIDRSKAIGMSHKKLLEGLLGKRRTRVVIKIADVEEDLENEWLCSLSVSPHNLNFLRYLCFFRCDDSLPRVVEEALNGRCRGRGQSMQVLVMEHVEGGSMKNYDWSRHPADVLQDFILQAVFALLDAHVACGFCHGDFHLDNVLVAKTTRDFVAYPKGGRIQTHGLLAKLMDFELSRVGTRPAHFFKDLREFFGKSLSILVPFVTVAPLQECYVRARTWAEDGEEDPCKALSLVPIIRTLEALKMAPTKGGGKPSEGPRVTPNICKSCRLR